MWLHNEIIPCYIDTYRRQGGFLVGTGVAEESPREGKFLQLGGSVGLDSHH